MEEFFTTNTPYYIILMYIAIKEGFPVIGMVFSKILPIKIAERKSNEDRIIELEEKRADLRERDTVAYESINRVIILLKNGQEHHAEETKTMMEGIASIGQGILVLLDRNREIRKGDDADLKNISVEEATKNIRNKLNR